MWSYILFYEGAHGNHGNPQSLTTGRIVKDLIGKVMTGAMNEETFLSELAVALESPPQPHLLGRSRGFKLPLDLPAILRLS